MPRAPTRLVPRRLARGGRELDRCGPCGVGPTTDRPLVGDQTVGLSVVLRVPCAGPNEGDTAVYLKATCDLFRAEPMITQALGLFARDHVPSILSADHDRAWMLMEPLPGAGSESPPSMAVTAAEVLPTVQLAALSHLDELARAGCPDRGLQPTLDGLRLVIDDSTELHLLSVDERATVAAMEPWLTGKIGEFYQCGIPITVGHGDLNLGNLASDGARVVLYDWTDACLTHPFLDAAHLAQSRGVGDKNDVLAAFSRSWRDAFPSADVDHALELAPLVNKAFQAIPPAGPGRGLRHDGGGLNADWACGRRRADTCGLALGRAFTRCGCADSHWRKSLNSGDQCEEFFAAAGAGLAVGGAQVVVHGQDGEVEPACDLLGRQTGSDEV